MKRLLTPVFLMLSHLAFAQAGPQPLPNLVRQAIDYFPRLKETQQAVRMSEIRTESALGQNKPAVNGTASYDYVWPLQKIQIPIPGVDRPLQFQPRNNYNVGVSVSQNVYDWGRKTAAVGKSQAEQRQAADNLDAQQAALAYQVAQVYYGIVFLHKNLAVQRDQLALVRETEAIIANRVRSGDEIDYNLVATQVRYKNVGTRIVDLQNQLERQYILLGSLLGHDAHGLVDTTAAPGGATVFGADPQHAYETALGSSHELRLSRDREAVAERDVALAATASKPSLAVVGQTGFRNGIQPEINRFQFAGIAGLHLTAPIYNGKKFKLQNDLARAALQQARYGTESQQVALREDLQQAQSDLAASAEKVRLSEAQVQQARYALQLANVRLKAGVVTPLEIQSAQTAVEEAEFNRLQFEYQRVLARLELNRLMGTKFW